MSFTYPTCYVSNLPQSATDQTVEDLFKTCEGLDRCVLKRDRKGNSLCYALATFDTLDNLAMAVETLKGTWIDGNLLTMSFVSRNSLSQRKYPKEPFQTLRDRPTTVYADNQYQPPNQFNANSYKYASNDPNVLASLKEIDPPHRSKALAATRLAAHIQPYIPPYNDQEDVLKYLCHLDTDLQFQLLTNPQLTYEKVKEARDYYANPSANERKVMSLSEVDEFRSTQKPNGEPATVQPSMSDGDLFDPTKRILMTGYHYPRYRRRLAQNRLDELARIHPHQHGRDNLLICVEEVYPGNPNNPIIAEAVLGISNAEYQRVIDDHQKLREKILEMGVLINDVRRIQFQQPLDVPHIQID